MAKGIEAFQHKWDRHVKCASSCYPLNLECPSRVEVLMAYSSTWYFWDLVETFEVGTVENLKSPGVSSWRGLWNIGLPLSLICSQPFPIHTFCHDEVSFQRPQNTGIKQYVLKPLTLQIKVSFLCVCWLTQVFCYSNGKLMAIAVNIKNLWVVVLTWRA